MYYCSFLLFYQLYAYDCTINDCKGQKGNRKFQDRPADAQRPSEILFLAEKNYEKMYMIKEEF